MRDSGHVVVCTCVKRRLNAQEERAATNQKTTVRHFGFTEKVYGLPFSTTPQQYNTVHNSCRGMPLAVRIAVEACRRRAASASILIIMSLVGKAIVYTVNIE